jgi:hypothetical protein
MCNDEIRIVYVDESHFHQDLDLGHTWAPGHLSANLYGEKALHRLYRHASTGMAPMTLVKVKL